jgi:hypothetical protein
VLLQLHQSLINNVAIDLLAGRTLDQQEIERLSVEILGKVPPELREQGRDPWSITFANEHPISLSIDDGQLAVTVRGQRYTSGDRRFDGMNVTARYELQNTGGVVEAVRIGDLDIYPPGFPPGGGRRIPLRLLTLRNLLKHRFETIFTPRIVSQGIALAGVPSRGKLDLARLQADQGWMVLGWRFQAGSATLASTEGSPLALATPPRTD